ncbi:hypothetical protein FO495_29925, partial [Bacillus tropicus]|nr:hypothetical protein [Bacillus tropicus]
VFPPLLQKALPNLPAGPAPVVCHMTSVSSPGDAPDFLVRSIMNRSVPSFPVLIANIFISDEILHEHITNIKKLEGIMPNTEITDE